MSRVCTLLRGVGVKLGFAVMGGITKNIGVVRKLEERGGLDVLLPEEPRIVGAALLV